MTGCKAQRRPVREWLHVPGSLLWFYFGPFEPGDLVSSSWWWWAVGSGLLPPVWRIEGRWFFDLPAIGDEREDGRVFLESFSVPDSSFGIQLCHNQIVVGNERWLGFQVSGPGGLGRPEVIGVTILDSKA